MNNKALLKYHSIFGIIAGIFLFILGITGSILMFNEELDATTIKKYQVETASKTLNLDNAIANIQKEYPKWGIRIIHFKEGETMIFSIRKPDARRLLFAHPETGKVIGNIDEYSLITKWLLKLHYSLHAGLIGRFLVLFSGICFLLSLITGIVLYRKVIMKTLLFKVKLKTSNKRTFYSILHRYIGVWALLLNMVLAITGILLAYKVTQSGMNEAVEPTPPLIKTSLEKKLQEIKETLPDFEATYIRLPTNKDRDIIINGKFTEDPFYFSQHYNKIKIDYTTGAIKSITKIGEESLINKFNSTVTPLHFGQYAGMFGKVLYAIIGLSGPFLSITGYFIWYKRKKKVRKKTTRS